jgi:hypothetical protein
VLSQQCIYIRCENSQKSVDAVSACGKLCASKQCGFSLIQFISQVTIKMKTTTVLLNITNNKIQESLNYPDKIGSIKLDVTYQVQKGIKGTLTSPTVFPRMVIEKIFPISIFKENKKYPEFVGFTTQEQTIIISNINLNELEISLWEDYEEYINSEDDLWETPFEA